MWHFSWPLKSSLRIWEGRWPLRISILVEGAAWRCPYLLKFLVCLCRMKQEPWDFPLLLRITLVDLRSWETNLIEFICSDWTIIAGHRNVLIDEWQSISFKWKIQVKSTDWLHVGLSGSLTEHDVAFWSSSSSWPNQLIFCNCSFSFGIIKTQPK